jgi:RNA polymerase sigma factor (sigma-70 family)
LRAERILKSTIQFIPSDEFEGLLNAKTSLKKFEVVAPRKSRAKQTFADAEPLTCLAPALSEPLLSFMEEQHEFRRMNYLKFLAARLRETLNAKRPSVRKLEAIEQALADAASARDHIIQSNLRLVISNAGKYCSNYYGFEDLVSDGSLALMEAVDKFDYGRGFRFSTYAKHAIRRSFFRKMERKHKDKKRFVVTDPDIMTSTPDDFEVDYDAPAESRLINGVIETLGDYLTDRELHIVEGRFGLNGRSEPQTLMELSGELGICKERVRQLEGLALKKLHSVCKKQQPAPLEKLEPVSA